MSKKRRLGRGLGALIDEADAEHIAVSVGKTVDSAESGSRNLPVDKIVPNRFQPRNSFDPEAIAEMAASIEAQGLIQPVVVNDRGDGKYEMISGERRLRAVKKLGWKEIPVIIHQVDRSRLLEMTLVENLQREDLNPIEEARGYKKLSHEFSLTQAQIAERVGRDRATVANSMRLLRLPVVIQQAVSSGALTAGHARQLLAVESEAEQIELARKVIEGDISVRKLEIIVRERNLSSQKRVKDKAKGEVKSSQDAYVADLETKLRRAFNTQVRIRQRGDGKGKIEIEFYSYEEFERLMELFKVPLG